MSSEAVNWVRDKSTVSGDLYAMLLTIASYTDRNGQGCTASAATLAKACRVGERWGKRILSKLREKGFIEPGDQSLVAHWPPDKRTTVYDVVGVPLAPERGGVQTTGWRTDHPAGWSTASKRGGVQTTQDLPSYGRKTGANGGQGSAPPPAANDQQHAFVVDSVSPVCGECQFPRSNRRHTSEAAA